MSLALDDQKVGWDARLEQWGDDLIWVGRNGEVRFRGTIVPLQVIDPETLVPDIRELDQLQMYPKGIPEFAAGDIVKREKDGARWKILPGGRINSDADFIAIFKLVKITPFDQ